MNTDGELGKDIPSDHQESNKYSVSEILQNFKENRCKKRRLNEQLHFKEMSFSNDDENPADTKTVSNEPYNLSIFEIEMIAIEILKNLDHADFLKCRLLNSCFHFCAPKVMQKKFKTSIGFTYCWKSRAYLLEKPSTVQESTASAKTLSSFTKLLKTSSNFPFKNFKFFKGYLGEQSLQEFLPVYGEHITDIFIDVISSPPEYLGISEIIPTPTISDLRKLLVDQLPNLQYLRLGSIPEEWRTAGERDRLFVTEQQRECKFTLPHLRTAIMPCHNNRQFFEDILEAGVNLTSLDADFELELIQKNKCFLQKSLNFRPWIEEITLYDRILNPPKSYLKQIGIDLYPLFEHYDLREKAASQLQTILEANAATLTHFSINSPCSPLDDINFEIPQLPKVSCLRIITMTFAFLNLTGRRPLSNSQKAYLPAGFEFQNSFPNLTTIKFGLFHLSADEDYEDLFRNIRSRTAPTAPTVRTLIFIETETESELTNFLYLCAECFPNVEHLAINSKFMEKAPWNGMYDFKNVKYLYCNINVRGLVHWDPDFSVLDQVFTGFSEQTCRRLHKYHGELFTTTLDKLDQSNSVRSLKGLKTLTVNILDSNCTNRLHWPLLFSHVTGLFAFKLVPQATIKFNINVKTEHNFQLITSRLRPIMEYVCILNTGFDIDDGFACEHVD